MTKATLVLDQLKIMLEGQALVALDATIEPGEVLTLMGPSGVGKSTLLAAVGGHLDPAFEVHGHIRLGDRNLGGLPAEARRVGILFQDPLLFPHLSVLENLLFGVCGHVRGRRARRRLAEEALADAGLEGFAKRDPATLSGGQQARVALLRVLLAEPSALLLDEPFNKLDAQLRDDMRRFVFARIRERGLPTLLVTHDPDDAQAAGGRVYDLAAT